MTYAWLFADIPPSAPPPLNHTRALRYTLEAVLDAPNSFNRWGLPQGQGALAGAVGAQFVLPGVLSETINSGLSAEDAAKQATDEANAIKEDLGL